ncbi:type II toxin-antitoxin system RelE family toxin [Ohtaekwangia sp.]|uniref:type II toxin-antitoxin system RelE family toxin n=1 Tax=Ohtaekwangia sp. TaxID=2066019 RepID=UPI0039C9818F
MKVLIDKSFEKDTQRISNKLLLNKIADCIEEIEKASSPSDIKNLKKLKGGNIYYRIRISDYRLGVIIKNNSVIFLRFLHRKDVYKYFP